jgi:hypothetical protein
MSEAPYRREVPEEPEGHRELHRGRPREKPGTTFVHNDAMSNSVGSSSCGSTGRRSKCASTPAAPAAPATRSTTRMYAEAAHRGAVVPLAALPGVTIDRDALFAP